MIPPLFQHQSDALSIARNQNLCIFHDCGTGKCRTSLEIIKHWKLKSVGPALVVCPKSIIKSGWIEDCEKFTPDLSIISLRDKKPARRYEKLEEKHDIYVVNFEQFKAMYREIIKKRFEILIIDESSKLKSAKNQITQALLSLAGINYDKKSKFKSHYIVPHRYTMSGTPAPNQEGEYWGQVKFITGPVRAGLNPNYYAFRSKYFSKLRGVGGNDYWKFEDEWKDHLLAEIAPYCDVVRKKDVLDLPEQTFIRRPVELGPKEMAAYLEMKRSLVVDLAAYLPENNGDDVDQFAVGANILSKIMKLREITSGFVYYNLEDGVIRDRPIIKTAVLGDSKLIALMDLFDEIKDEQVITWCNYTYEINVIKAKLESGTYGIISGQGDTSDEAREVVIKGFQDSKFQYLLANSAAAAHGLTFVNCCYAIDFSTNYSFELHKQKADRIHRIGQTRPCTYYHLLANGTIDSDIYDIVRGKKTKYEVAMEFIRKRRK